MLDRARPGPVLILPTASAPEGDEVFDGWGRMGVEHYARLGVEAEVLPVKRREDAERADLASRLDDAAAVFLSGGNPGSLAATLAGTRFWTSLVANLDRGLAYGGCSAGIAALGERAAWRLHRNSFWPGLGVFPGTNLAPHWDAVDAYLPGLAQAWRTSAPRSAWWQWMSARRWSATAGGGRCWGPGAYTSWRTAGGPTTALDPRSTSTWRANLPLVSLHAMIAAVE